MTARSWPEETEAERVAEWLRAHPGFLAERPDLLSVLAPPRRVHGDNVTDHLTAMVRRARAEATDMAARAERVLQAGRASAGLSARVQDAVVALIAAPDPAACVAEEFPALLAVDAAVLRTDLGREAIGFALAGRDAAFGIASADLFAEAAPLAVHTALARVPGPRPALLALGAREPAVLDARQGLGPLLFLARALGAALHR
jgi:hypothetical protein